MNIKISKGSLCSAADYVLLIIGILGLLGLAFFEAFTGMLLWNWFIPPATGWGKISYWLSFGIILTIEIFAQILSRSKGEEKDGTPYSLIGAVVGRYLAYGLVIGIGALVQLGI